MKQEHLDVVTRVIDTITMKFSFHEVDDIRQEAFIIADEIIELWDGIRPLENFLAVSIRRRLISLKRDTYYRPLSDSGAKKKAALDLVSYDGDIEWDKIPIEDKISLSDEVEFILDNLPPSMRSDFLRLANGVSLSPTRKTSLFNKVREINETREIE